MKKAKKPKKLRTKIAEGVSLGIFLLSLVLVAISLISATTGNPANFFGYSFSYVPTPSMEPNIQQGSFIVIKKDSFSQVEVDDIIVYRAVSGPMQGNLIVHRVVKINDNGTLQTKGDNNPVPDFDDITEDMFYGDYVSTVFSGLDKMNIDRNVIFGGAVLMFVRVIVAQVINISMTAIKQKQDKEEKAKKDLAMEEMRKEIYEEELAKLKEELNKDKK